ncbi:SulP family inorganic anion transporter, partial [Elizabethkingia meningoseptica]|uniref:SulP family inorganic anion transporter n=1 Tax=Elizabethkingia meningoseptica TaxID=238 RepID=UPI00319C0026
GTLRTAWGPARTPAHVMQVSLDQVLHNGFGGEHQGLVGADTYLMCDPDEFVAQTLAARRRQRIEPDQELVGLGAANLASAFSGGYPVTGGFARSVVNADAGAETPMAGVFAALG